MNRRDFLKTLGVTALTLHSHSLLAIPSEKVGEYPYFKPDSTYGNSMLFSEELSEDERVEAIKLLDMDMVKVIPPHYHHKVTYPEHGFGDGTIDPFDEVCVISWKYIP